MAEATSERAQDRRIVRTKQALRTALIALTEERGLEGFTVNDLCERADINRSTFYNHFHDKDELLRALEAEVMADLEAYRAKLSGVSALSVARANARKTPLPLLVELFEYLRGQGDFLHAMLGAGGDAGFAPALSEFVCNSLVRPMLHERYRTSDDPFVGYYLAFYANAYLGIITRWVQTGMQESSEDMARIAMRLLFIQPGEPIKL